MSKATVIALFLLGIVFAHALAGQCSATDRAKTKACLDAHFDNYGIEAGKGLPKFDAYIAMTVKHLEQHGAAVFDLYCDNDASLAACLGALKNSPCMKAEGFETIYGLGKYDARSYATSFPVQAYTCEHKQEAKPHVACIWTVSQNHPKGVADCLATMIEEMKKATDYCVPSDRFMTCVENHFAKYCKEDVRSFICNQQKVALDFAQDGHCAEKMHKC